VRSIIRRKGRGVSFEQRVKRSSRYLIRADSGGEKGRLLSHEKKGSRGPVFYLIFRALGKREGNPEVRAGRKGRRLHPSAGVGNLLLYCDTGRGEGGGETEYLTRRRRGPLILLGGAYYNPCRNIKGRILTTTGGKSRAGSTLFILRPGRERKESFCGSSLLGWDCYFLHGGGGGEKRKDTTYTDKENGKEEVYSNLNPGKRYLLPVEAYL